MEVPGMVLVKFKALQGLRDHKDPLGLQDPPVHKGLQGRWGQRERRVPQDHRGPPVQRVLPEQLDHRDHKGFRAYKVPQDPKVRPDP